MKRKFMRFTALLLVLSLLLPFTGVSALQKKSDGTKTYKKMFSVGDSVSETWGWHLEDLPLSAGETNRFYCTKKLAADLLESGAESKMKCLADYGTGAMSKEDAEAYAQELRGDTVFGYESAEALVEDNDVIHYQIAGLRSSDFLWAFLEENPGEEDWNEDYCDVQSADARLNIASAVLNRDVFKQAVTESDLITLELGINDVVLYATMEVFEKDLTGMEVNDIVSIYTKYLREGFENFVEDMPHLIEAIIELKAEKGQKIGVDYDLAVMNVYNPVFGLELGDALSEDMDLVTPIGQVASLITATMNEYFAKWAKMYGYCLVDISAVSTGLMEGETYGSQMKRDIGTILSGDNITLSLMTHPSFPDGYDYIVRQTEAALTAGTSDDLNIRVDTNAMETLLVVRLGGENLSTDEYKYEAENSLLTVYNSGKDSATLTIIGTKDGSLRMQTYRVSYEEGTGMKTSLLYSTPDVETTATRLAANIRQAFRNVLTRVRNLFKTGENTEGN